MIEENRLPWKLGSFQSFPEIREVSDRAPDDAVLRSTDLTKK